MAWHLSEPEHRIFSRNPLVATVVELQYHPILKIASGKGVADFQDRIRADFPHYSEVKSRVVKFKSPNDVEIRDEKHFQFRKENQEACLTLTDSSIILETRKHRSHINVLQDMELAVKVVTEVYASVKATRLGMRYINIIDRQHISDDTNKEIDWNMLIRDDFLKIPNNLADLDGTAYWTEINSPVAENGYMTLRYGFPRSSLSAKMQFRFDVDRYLENPFQMEQTCGLLNEFARDIYAVFLSMAGPELRVWMES